MKAIILVNITLLSMFSTVFAAPAKYKVPKLKAVGFMQFPVISQTKPIMVKKNAHSVILRKFFIARQGVERFQYGAVDYKCSNKCEMMGQPILIQMFEDCVRVKKTGQPVCKKSVKDSYVSLEASSNEESMGRHWYTCEDSNSGCYDQDELNEYPARYTPEDADLPNGF